MNTIPSESDYLIELIYQDLATAQSSALNKWRSYIGDALESWNLSLVSRLLRELSRHELGTIGKAYLKMGLGGLSFKEGEWKRAKDELEFADNLFSKTDDCRGRCWVLTTLGNLYADQGMWEPAFMAYDRSIKLYQELGDEYGEAQVLVNLGTIHYTQSHWGEALVAYRRSLDIFLRVGDSASAALSLSGLGHILVDLGNYDEAIECYLASLEIFVSDQDIQGQVSTLNNIGRVYDSSGQYDTAVGYYQKSLELARQQGDLRSQATALDNLGVTLQSLKRYKEAVICHKEALDTYRELGDRLSASASLNHLGMAHHRLHQFGESEVYFREAIVIKRELDDLRGLASVLINYALLCLSQDRWDDIAQAVDESIKFSEETHSDETLATGFVIRGLINLSVKSDISATGEYFAKAIETAWSYHPTTGQRINRFLLGHLKGLLQKGHASVVYNICQHIIEFGRSRIGEDNADALDDYERLSSEANFHKDDEKKM